MFWVTYEQIRYKKTTVNFDKELPNNGYVHICYELTNKRRKSVFSIFHWSTDVWRLRVILITDFWKRKKRLGNSDDCFPFILSRVVSGSQLHTLTGVQCGCKRESVGGSGMHGRHVQNCWPCSSCLSWGCVEHTFLHVLTNRRPFNVQVIHHQSERHSNVFVH